VGTTRARPLPPDQRRAALVAPTLPLVARHGVEVTTKQIAEAAGVAEGTIFRVFPDKEALVRAAVAAAIDPLPVIAELGGVDTDLPLRERLTETVGILQRRITGVFNLLVRLGMDGPPKADESRRTAGRATREQILPAVVRVLAPDEARFRHPVPEVARLVHLLTVSGSHPLLTDGRPLSAEQITSVLLDGVLHQSDHDTNRGDRPC
jgi:AcrR family transcriptional regulator